MSELPAVLVEALATYRRCRGATALAAGAAEAVAAGLVGVGILAAADALLHPGAGMRLVGGVAVWTGSAAILLGRGVRPWLRRDHPVALARDLERAAGLERAEPLSGPVSLVLSPTPGTSPWMASRALALAAQTAADLPVRALVDHRPARRRLLLSAALAALAVSGGFVPGGTDLLLRAAWPWARIARPAATVLMVTPGDRRVPEGSALVLSATATPAPETVTALLQWDGAEPEVVALRPVAGPEGQAQQWRAELPAVVRPFTYTIQAGDAESQPYRINIAQPLRVGAVGLVVTPPAYSGLPVRRLDGGDATLVRGSAVTLSARIDGPVAAATALVDGAEVPARLTDGQVRVDVAPETDAVVALRLVDRDGLTAEPPQRWSLRVVADAPPAATMTVAGLDGSQSAVGASELLTVTIAASDDLGLVTLALEVTAGLGEPALVSLALPADGRPTDPLATVLDLAPFGLAPGDDVVLVAVATDRGGQQARSAPLRAVVGGDGAAELAAAELRLRDHLDRLETARRDLDGIERAWGALVARPGDGAAHRAEVSVLAARATAWADDGAGVAAAIAAEAPGLPAGAGAARDLLARSAAGLAAWIPRCRADLSGQAGVQSGHAAALAAVAELASWRRTLELGTGRLTAERQVLAAEADRRRAERAGLLVRGDRAWGGETAGNGLEATWYLGNALAGEVAARSRGAPSHDPRPAGIGDTGYSVRWSGEVRIPTAGRWTFVGTADDGLRLRVGGTAIAPDSAWREQQPTPYTGTVELAAGWHPIVVEFYQAGGGAFLALTYGREGAAQRPLTVENLRNAGGGTVGVDPALVALMVQAGPTLGATASDSLAAALAGLARVPPALSALAGPTAMPRIAELAHPQIAATALLAAADPHQWGLSDLATALTTGQAVQELALTVRDLVETACVQVPPPPTDALLADLAAARDHGERARRQADQGNTRAAGQALAAAAAATTRAFMTAATRLAAQPANDTDRQVKPQLERIVHELIALARVRSELVATPEQDPQYRTQIARTLGHVNAALGPAHDIVRLTARPAPDPIPASTDPTLAKAVAAETAARACRLATAERTAQAALTSAVSAQAIALERAKAGAVETRADRPAAAAVPAALATADQAAAAATAAAERAANERSASSAADATKTRAASAERVAAERLAAALAPVQAAAMTASERSAAEAVARARAGDEAGARAATERAADLKAAAAALATASDANAVSAASILAARAAAAVTDSEAPPAAVPTPAPTFPDATPEAAAALAALAAQAAQAAWAVAEAAVAQAAHKATCHAAAALADQVRDDASRAAAAAESMREMAAHFAAAKAASEAAATATNSTRVAEEQARAAAAATKAASEVAALAARTAPDSRIRTVAAPVEQALKDGAARLTAAVTDAADPAAAKVRQAQIAAAAQRIADGLGNLPDPDRADAGILADLAKQTRAATTASTAHQAGQAAARDWAEPLARAALVSPAGDQRVAAVTQGREAAATAARTQAAAERLARLSTALGAAQKAAAEAARQAEAAEATERASAAQAISTAPGMVTSKAGSGTGVGTQDERTRSDAALTTADWARLSDPARREVLSGGGERFAPEQQEAIRAYLERLGSAR